MGLFHKLFAKGRRQRASLLNIQGIELAKKGSYKEAQQLFEQAIEIAPDYPHPRVNLSNILARNGRYSQAEVQLRKALELNPDNKIRQDAWNNLGNIRFAQKGYFEAINFYKSAISGYESDYEIYYNIGISLKELGEWEDALDYLNRSNNVFRNPDAQLSIKRLKQQMWRSCEIEQIVDSYKGFDTLFSIGLVFQGDLDSCIISENLRQEFEDNKVSLSQNATILIIERSNRWQIDDEQFVYTVKKRKDKLNIIRYPKCGKNRLAPDELEKVENVPNDSLIFFVGAGISSPYPSCLPKASKILREVFHFIFALDKPEICEILQISTQTTEDEAHKRLSHDLMGITHEVSDCECSLPFEATFQALYDVLGFPVIRFVDLLKGGKSNLHHKMLAYALHKGHTVITTNFDKQIEEAYKCFKKPLQILVTDKDYHEAIENNRINGVLAKIHGDLDDYNSLALTLQGVALSCDSTMYLGDDIDREKGIKQLQLSHPRTFLSIPKALFFQGVLKDRKIVVLGYSGSDVFDIMPILSAPEFRCGGLWVEHTSKPLSKEIEKCEKWKSNGEKRDVLQPSDKETEKLDITSKVSRYFFNVFGGSWEEEKDENRDIESMSVLLESWIHRLRLRPGDGLFCLAMLCLRSGKWDHAILFCNKAMEKYEKDMEHNEWRWLVAKSNLGLILEKRDKKDQALKNYTEVQKYIEDSEKQRLYWSLYADTLLNIAGKWINTVKDIEAGEMVNKAMEIAKEIEDRRILCHGLRLTADRHMGKKEYKEALEIYLRVHQLSSDVFGDCREACLSSMHAAICLARMGQQYNASQMLSTAKNFARYLGDEQLINAVEDNQGFVASLFVGESPTWPYHKELEADAKRQVSDTLAKEMDELLESIGFEQYDRALEWIDRLLLLDKDKPPHPDVQAYLLFLKSNLYQRARRPKEEIEILKKFCEIKPNHPLAEHNLGGAYSRLKKYELAEKHYIRAIELMNGNYPLSICNLGILYTKMSKLQKAKEQLVKAEKLKAPEHSLIALKQRIAELEKIPKNK